MHKEEGDDSNKLTWREKMIRMLTVVGQLKRKGKFDLNSEFMRRPKKEVASQNAISDPNANSIDPNLLLYGNLK